MYACRRFNILSSLACTLIPLVGTDKRFLPSGVTCCQVALFTTKEGKWKRNIYMQSVIKNVSKHSCVHLSEWWFAVFLNTVLFVRSLSFIRCGVRVSSLWFYNPATHPCCYFTLKLGDVLSKTFFTLTTSNWGGGQSGSSYYSHQSLSSLSGGHHHLVCFTAFVLNNYLWGWPNLRKKILNLTDYFKKITK